MNEATMKLMMKMVENNPQFKQFAQQNQGKSMEEVCKRYGIDPEIVKNIIGVRNQ